MVVLGVKWKEVPEDLEQRTPNFAHYLTVPAFATIKDTGLLACFARF
jgi:hypothetical protein